MSIFNEHVFRVIANFRSDQDLPNNPEDKLKINGLITRVLKEINEGIKNEHLESVESFFRNVEIIDQKYGGNTFSDSIEQRKEARFKNTLKWIQDFDLKVATIENVEKTTTMIESFEKELIDKRFPILSKLSEELSGDSEDDTKQLGLIIQGLRAIDPLIEKIENIGTHLAGFPEQSRLIKSLGETIKLSSTNLEKNILKVLKERETERTSSAMRRLQREQIRALWERRCSAVAK